MTTHDHPIFTRVYSLLARLAESGNVGVARTQAAQDLSGRLLIVGLGPGHDLQHLPAAVTEVVAVEPSPSMRAEARTLVERSVVAGVPVELIAGVGEALPLPDDDVDSVLLAYVMCTVSDPERVLAEIDRVLRPGGTIGVLEHVVAADGSVLRRVQRLAAPWWPRLGGGCHCDRDTDAAFRAAGLDTSGIRKMSLANLPPVSPALVGTVRRLPSSGAPAEPPGLAAGGTIDT